MGAANVSLLAGLLIKLKVISLISQNDIYSLSMPEKFVGGVEIVSTSLSVLHR